MAKVEAGSYQGRVVDWGLQEVPSLKTMRVKIKFTTTSGDVYFDGLLTKKDGTPNQKTVDTLLTCGFSGKATTELASASALNTQKPLNLTVVVEKTADGKEYSKVEWVNDPEKSGFEKADVKVVKGYDLRKVDALFANANKTTKVKNYAEGIVAQSAEDDSPLPF